MRKADFLKLVADQLSALSDDDEVLIECDGGDYWGKYLAQPKIGVDRCMYPENGVWIGHPGNPSKIEGSYPNAIAVLREA